MLRFAGYEPTSPEKSPSRPLNPILAVSTVLAGLALTSPSHAQNMWNKHKWDCQETAFSDPETPLQVVARCVRIWEAYRDLATVKQEERDRVVRVIRRLYREGSDKEAHIARIALNRLGVAQLPKRRPLSAAARAGTGDAAAGTPTDADIAATAAPETRIRCTVPPPSRAERKAAQKRIRAGKKAAKRNDQEEALAHHLAAVDLAPGLAAARYHAAAGHAALGQDAEMVEQLTCLQAIGDKDAVTHLRKARRDDDFRDIRDRSAGFKRVTGYARIKIGNSLGEYGEDNVENLEASLERLGMRVEEVTSTTKKYGEPHIWFKPECKTAVYFVMKVMAHPRTKTHIITWDDEPFDVMIAWGDAVRKGSEPKVYVRDPQDAERKLNDLANAQDEALRKPEAIANDVDRAVGTPERVEQKVDGSIRRAGRTLERIESSGDKIKRIFE